MYYLANSQYASSFEELDIEMPGGQLDTSNDNHVFYDWGVCYLQTTNSAKQAACKNNDISMEYQ